MTRTSVVAFAASAALRALGLAGIALAAGGHRLSREALLKAEQ